MVIIWNCYIISFNNNKKLPPMTAVLTLFYCENTVLQRKIYIVRHDSNDKCLGLKRNVPSGQDIL